MNGGEWSSAVPGAIDVGNYEVEARLEGRTADGIVFANNSDTIPKTVTINPPVVKASSLTGVFNQGDKRVNLSWDAPSIPGNYADFKWVVYRNGTRIAALPSSVHTYSDNGYTNETNPVYDVYYVSNFWDIATQRDDTKASVTVSTTRSVPVNNLMVEQEPERIVFTWTSDAYPEGFGHKFLIYAGDDEDPICTLTPADMQTSFQWEHRTTDQHTNRQSHIDPETGVPYTEEPLNACAPRPYRIEGVIGNVLLNAIDISPKSIDEATKIYNVDASKGVYEGSVKLSWHVDLRGSLYAKTYIVERRRAEQEKEAWEVLTRMSSNENYLFYTDETALPGVFYDYRITVEDKCDDGSTVTSEKGNIGFAKSTGTVTGRIAYGSTGTAVQGVDVVMTMTSSEGDQLEQFHSIYFSDVIGAVTWKYPEDEDSKAPAYATEKFATGDFSVQMWLYPEAFNESTILDFGNGIGLGMTATGGLAFSSVAGGSPAGFEGIALRQNTYNHIVLTRSGTTLTCYVLTLDANSSEPDVQKASLTMADGTLALTDAKEFSLGRFKGAVDEFRLWTKCLSEADLLENYDHLLVGDEQQLETYWTFDEGLRTQFFDYSRDGTNYRKHHGTVGSNAQASTLTPAALRLKAKTNADGNYIIQGIPFTGEGTTYSVIPLYGIHEFNPAKTLLFVGKNALVHTANFEDVSSFPMTGYMICAGRPRPSMSFGLTLIFAIRWRRWAALGIAQASLGRTPDAGERIVPLSGDSYLFTLENALALYKPRVDGEAGAAYPELRPVSIRVSDRRKAGADSLLNLGISAPRLPYRFGGISFRLAYPVSGFTEDVRHRAYLEGLDPDWKELRSAPEASYSYLPSGRYVFHIQARAYDGTVLSSWDWPFRIKPPFWRSGWAYALYAAILALIALGTANYFITRNREQLERLEREKLESEVKLKSKELAASTMELVRKREVLIELRDEKDPRRIRSIIDSQLRSDDDWAVFEKNFDNIHENFFANLRRRYPALTDTDLRFCAYLHLNLTSKDIASLMNISLKGVEAARSRIRKKIQLPSDKSLTAFMIELK